MSLIEAIILGIVQGLTEFLPVSSSGHIELVKSIFGAEIKEGLLFTIVLHGATALSTVVVFRKDLLDIIKGGLKFKWNDETKFAWYVVISMIPAALVGFCLDDKIEAFFTGKSGLVATMLLVTGIVLLISDKAKSSDSKQLDTKTSFIMGLVQAIAILPGISRSGSTIVTGVLLGLNRTKAARFSFIMVLPLIGGVVAKKLLDFMGETEAAQEALPVAQLSIGFVAAFVSGLFAIKWMIKLVENSQLKWFAYYCFVVGGVALAYSLFV
jgi:undecaprenyl-diphosphatase